MRFTVKTEYIFNSMHCHLYDDDGDVTSHKCKWHYYLYVKNFAMQGKNN